jgi:hypothetical protein
VSARDDLQISERELGSMTKDLDELHKDTFPQAREAIADWGSRLARTTASRRTLLLGGVGVAGAAALAACGSSKSSSPASSSSPAASASGATYTGDLQVVALAAALENLGVAGYGIVLKAATAGTYGTVPPAVATFATTVQAQHQDHAGAWNSVLSKAGKPTITTFPLSNASAIAGELTAAKTLPDALTVATAVENVAASTYLEAVGAVTDPGGISVAATIAPVEAMHAAILNLLLGHYPVPASYLTLDSAEKPSMLTV